MKPKKHFSDTYIVKFGWMVEITETRYEADLLALVYGFSQDGESEFTGSIKYMQKWLQCSRGTVIKTAQALVDAGLLIKEQQTVNGVVFNRYKVDLNGVSAKRTGGSPDERGSTRGGRGGTSPERGSTRGEPNNTINIPIDNSKYKLEGNSDELQAHSQNTLETYSTTSPDAEKEKSCAKKEKDAQAVELMEYYNMATNQTRSTATSGRGSKNVTWIKALLRKGYSPDEVKLMIDYKCYEWWDSPKMRIHLLNPETIFKRHGEEYIEQAIQARDNPEVMAAIKKAKEKEGGPVKVSADIYNTLKNW